jgi:hypothetical protein
MEQIIIQTCKQYLNENRLDECQDYIQSILLEESHLDWPVLFHRVYLHACLKGRESIADWLRTSLFPTMDPIQQIALRQIFPYGRVLLSQAKTRVHA